MVDWDEPHNPGATATADGRLYRDELARLRAENERLTAELAVQRESKEFAQRCCNLADARALAAEAREAKAVEALRDIAESDDIDNALAPARNKRVALAALASLPKESADAD